MRKDMNKLLCERARIGHSAPSLKTGKRLDPRLDYLSDDFDWGPSRVPTSRRRQHGWNSKELNENLNPLQNFLYTSVGRPWDAVYSEIRENLRPTKAIDFHVLVHLKQMVQTEVYMEDGKPHHNRYSSWDRWRVDDLYVNPETGLLCKVVRDHTDHSGKSIDTITSLNWHHNVWFEKVTIKKTHCCTSTNSIIGRRNRKWVNDRFVEFPYDTKEYCQHGLVAEDYAIWYVIDYGYHSPDEIYRVYTVDDYGAAIRYGLNEFRPTHTVYYRDMPNELTKPIEIRRKTANKKELKLIRSLLASAVLE